MTKRKTMTLRQFVTKAGSQEKAARIIGWSTFSVGRWLRGEFNPDDHARQRLDELGIGEIG